MLEMESSPWMNGTSASWAYTLQCERHLKAAAEPAWSTWKWVRNMWATSTGDRPRLLIRSTSSM